MNVEVTMNEPSPEVYEQCLQYWPYATSLREVIEWTCLHALPSARVLEVMCGPGYLLGQLSARRPDLALRGVDISRRYVTYGSRTYHDVAFEQGDVLSWRPDAPYDVVLCLGALHHIPYGRQGEGIGSIVRMVRKGGTVIISDCYIGDYRDETERMRAAERLGHEYLKHTINKGAPKGVVEVTADILRDDLMCVEYKTSLRKRLPLLLEYFPQVTAKKVWPQTRGNGFGDYIHHLIVPQ